ncbi:MAG: hypothetical protein LC640_12815, partial [Frankia sp.]|nr:hypothetical protein [Frankia sp.]
ITKYPLPTPMGISNDVVAGPDGAYWFTEIIGSKIGRIVPSAPRQIREVALTAGSTPDSIVVGPDGNLWFTEWSGHIARMSWRAPYAVQEFPVTSRGIPHKLVVGHDGHLWFTEPFNNSVGRVTVRRGAAPVIEEFRLPTDNARPTGLAVGRGHDLWVTELVSGKIARLDDRTGFAVAEYPLADGSAPTDLTMDRSGDVWFAEAGSTAIGRLHPPPLGHSATISECPVPTTPYFVAAAPNGDIWFTEFHDPGISIGRIKS